MDINCIWNIIIQSNNPSHKIFSHIRQKDIKSDNYVCSVLTLRHKLFYGAL